MISFIRYQDPYGGPQSQYGQGQQYGGDDQYGEQEQWGDEYDQYGGEAGGYQQEAEQTTPKVRIPFSVFILRYIIQEMTGLDLSGRQLAMATTFLNWRPLI